MNDQKILVIIGPSASGKSTIAKRLVEDGIITITPSWTSRPMRPSEAGGFNPEHVFVNQEEFDSKKQDDGFLETVQLFGLPYWYGLPKIKMSKNSVPTIMLRAPLIQMVHRHYPEKIIYQIHSPIDRLESRLLKRQQQGDELGSRLSDTESEIRLGEQLADRVFINDRDIDLIIKEIKDSIKEDFR